MDWVKALRDYLLTAAKEILSQMFLKNIVLTFILSAFGVAGGWIGFIAKYILGKAYDFGAWVFKKWIIKEEVQIKNDKENEKYEKVIKNPDSKTEDIEKAVDDRLGGGFQ